MKQAISAKIKCSICSVYQFKTALSVRLRRRRPCLHQSVTSVCPSVPSSVRVESPYIFCLLVVASSCPSVRPSALSCLLLHIIRQTPLTTATETQLSDDVYDDNIDDDYDNNDAEGNAICHYVAATRRRQQC